jgi:Ca-activated chloride channel family protein
MLLLLALVPVWLWRMRLASQRGGLQYAAVHETMMPRSFWARFGPSLLIGLRGAALVLFIIALARPQIGKSETKIRSEGIEIALAVDVSGSMQAMDFEQNGQPVDRLTIVKQAVKEFIHARPNDRIGMIAFAGRAYVASPLTLDHDWLERNLDRVKVGLIEDGTAIGAGLGTAVNRLRDTKAKSRVVILLTDGVNNVQEVPPMEAAKAAKEFGVRVYTIGAGTMGLAPMPVMNRAGQVMGFQRVPVQIDEDLLTEIAKMTGGQYFRATDTDSLRRIYQQIDQMEK